MQFLSDEDKARLTPAEDLPHFLPIPTQTVSSDEYFPTPQTARQRELEGRLLAIGGEQAKRQGLSRRRFFQTAAGMAAAFAALNDTFGPMFEASHAEAATPEMADARAAALKGQMIIDMHTHFLRDDTRLTSFMAMRESVGKAGWNQGIGDRPQTMDDLKFENYVKEVFLDSDTKMAAISSAPSDVLGDWFLTNQQMAQARETVNARFGSKRMFSHCIFTPGQDGWLDQVDAGIALKPDCMKGYTISDSTHKDTSRYPWRMDDEKVTYKAFEKFVKAGIKNVAVHKGLFTIPTERLYPRLRPFVDVSDIGKAAKDWPQLNFHVFHSGYRHVGDDPAVALKEFEETGRLSWVSDLADIPGKYGVDNVYADPGQIFAMTIAAEPRIGAAIMGIILKGLGPDRVCWGTDAVWTGSPQWQIEALRRLEIPEDMQKRYGFKPLGAADGPVKTAIFSGNHMRNYAISPQRAQADVRGDRLAALKAEYERQGPEPSNLRYGFVAQPVDHTLFA